MITNIQIQSLLEAGIEFELCIEALYGEDIDGCARARLARLAA